jgi:hypothetical protein
MIFASDGMLASLVMFPLLSSSPLPLVVGVANAAKMDLHGVLFGEVRDRGNTSFPFN